MIIANISHKEKLFIILKTSYLKKKSLDDVLLSYIFIVIRIHVAIFNWEIKFVLKNKIYLKIFFN